MNRYLLTLLFPLLACLASCSDNDEPQPDPEMLFSIENTSDSEAYNIDHYSVDPTCGLPKWYFITVRADRSLEMTLKREDSSNPIMFNITGKYYAFEDEKTGMEASVTDNKLILKFSPIDNITPDQCDFWVRDKDDKNIGVRFIIHRCAPEILE